MVRFHAYTGFQSPGLHIWREGTDFKASVRPVAGLAADERGWVEFEYDLDPAFTPRVRFMLFDHDERGRPSRWERPSISGRYNDVLTARSPTHGSRKMPHGSLKLIPGQNSVRRSDFT
jgi:hypothetical protein